MGAVIGAALDEFINSARSQYSKTIGCVLDSIEYDGVELDEQEIHETNLYPLCVLGA